MIEKIINSINSERNGNKIFYVIGNNGSGKSQLLNSISNQYSEQSTSNILCITNSIYDRFKAKRPNEIYLGMKNVTNAIFFGSIERDLLKQIIMCIDNNSLTPIEKTLGIKFSANFGGKKDNDIENHIDKRKIKDKDISSFMDKGNIKIIKSLFGNKKQLSCLNKGETDAINSFLKLNPNNIEMEVEKDNKSIKFGQLSSGEKNRIFLALKISSHIKSNSLILIDEPEISLHLHWQITFHNFLRSLIKNYNGISVVIATHSPTIVSGAYHDDGKNTIIILGESIIQNYIEVDANSRSSFDDVTLNFFNSAMYKSNAIDEEIAITIVKFEKENDDDTKKGCITHLENIKKHVVGLNENENLKKAISILKEMHSETSSNVQ